MGNSSTRAERVGAGDPFPEREAADPGLTSSRPRTGTKCRSITSIECCATTVVRLYSASTHRRRKPLGLGYGPSSSKYSGKPAGGARVLDRVSKMFFTVPKFSRTAAGATAVALFCALLTAVTAQDAHAQAAAPSAQPEKKR